MEKSYYVKFQVIKAMKLKSVTVLLILALVLPLFLNFSFPTKASASSTGLYFGVDIAFESVSASEQLIDKVSSYTNLVVLGCTGFYNTSRLTVLSDYAFSKGLSFMIYSDSRRFPGTQWLANAQTNYGDKFLGIYWFDEEGGKQLDQQNYPPVTSAQNYSDAASKFEKVMTDWVGGRYSIKQSFPSSVQYPLFTSDYAFYWYDYKVGYDGVFAQLGWNYSRQVNIAQCRGAATAFNKDWGAIITWTYRQPPYIESGPELYSDLLMAYENGAKYILIFDSDKDYSQSILRQEHFDAMKQFWDYIQHNPRTIASANNRTAYVLPQYYAYGFRGPNDSIWGLWGPDYITGQICLNVSSLLQTYGNNLDIIYPSANQTIDSIGYKNVFYASDPPQDISPSSDPKLPEIYILAAAIASAAIIAGGLIAFKFGRNKSEKPANKLL
jgi:hypothetical protein